MEGGSLDTRILRRVAGLRRPWLNRAAIVYSASGNNGEIWIAIGAATALVRRDRDPLITSATAVLGTMVANGVVKRVVRRERPDTRVDLPPPVGGVPHSPSFPSAHAAMAGAGLVALAGIEPALLPLLAVTAPAMALSRVYLGVHYPSDIVVGFVFGAVAGRLLASLVS